MNSAVLCFLFFVILVNDICIFAKLGFKYKIHSAAIMGRLSSPGWNARQRPKLRLLANLQELRLMMFLEQKFPSSSLPWSAKPRTQRIHKLRVHKWSWRIGVTRKSKSKSRLIWAYIYIYMYIYLFIYLSKAWPIRPINFCWNSRWNCWTPTCMKPILFSSSVPLTPLPCRNTTPCRQMRRGALWPSTLLEVGSRATFSRFSPMWNPAAPLRRLPLKLLKGTCL